MEISMVAVVQLLIGFVALIHILIGLAEMFLWRKPFIHERIGFKQPEADKVASIVANAGLYNEFIAAGLIWGLLTATDAFTVQCFFLSCVCIAGIFGAVTLRWTTLALQTIPGLAALVAVLYTSHIIF